VEVKHEVYYFQKSRGCSMDYNNSFGSGPSFQLGGSGVVPMLISVGNNEQSRGIGPVGETEKGRTNGEKHASVVEYLKGLPSGSWATFIDFERVLSINLDVETHLLQMLLSNPRLEHQRREGDNAIAFQYRAPYIINNKQQLCENIRRYRNGIVLTDIKNCYPGIEADVSSLILGGDIIAVKCKEPYNSLVLYPRGQPFLTRLSGTVSATPGQQMVRTSADLQKELRRGEAVQVGEFWYRVGSAIGSGAAGEQIQRSAAPTSVSADKDLSDRNVYCDPYTAELMPLDGDFEGDAPFVGSCFRHGCTTDIKNCWKQTAEELRKFSGDGELLHRELVSLNLLSRHVSTTGNLLVRQRAQKTKPKRKQSKPRAGAAGASLYGVNAHVKGTELEKLIKEAQAKAERENS
jgi:hypothetical protein